MSAVLNTCVREPQAMQSPQPLEGALATADMLGADAGMDRNQIKPPVYLMGVT